MSGTGPSTRPSGFGITGVVLVFVGGAVGTAARAAVDGALGATLHAFPLHTLAINVVGSLLLGILLELLARRGPAPSRTRLRLLLGTGALGGFTTYSALAVSTAQLLLGGSLLAAAGYALGTVVLGLLAAGLGIALSARVSGRGDDTRSGDDATGSQP